jgi:hypothetical protein
MANCFLLRDKKQIAGGRKKRKRRRGKGISAIKKDAQKNKFPHSFFTARCARAQKKPVFGSLAATSRITIIKSTIKGFTTTVKRYTWFIFGLSATS